MRQLPIQVPKGVGQKVLAIAQDTESDQISLSQVQGKSGALDQVTLLLPNRDVGTLLSRLEETLPQASVALSPSAVLSINLPSDEVPQPLIEVGSRSPLEVYLEGLQSIGSWKSFLIYSSVAGVVVWIGLYTNSIELLVASMLIAPFGGPAMNVAIGSARGDVRSIKRSVIRYFTGILCLMAVTFVLSFLFGQSIASAQMVAVSEVAAPAFLLPIAGGIAGALQLVQSERSSLVSGTAIGMLVAAALAPPAGLTGMAAAIGRFDMVQSGAFLLVLQLVGINIACAIVFRLYGINPNGAVYARGKRRVFPVAIALSSLVLSLLLGYQFLLSPSPTLTRSSQSQRASRIVQSVVNNDQYVNLIESNVRFTRASIPGQTTLLSDVYVQPRDRQSIAESSTRRRLTEEIQDEILAAGFDVTPLVNITVLDPPSQ